MKHSEHWNYLILPPLKAEQASKYRSLVMRCAYLSQDRVDLCESVKSLARFMSSPTEHSWTRLKRLGRYLKGHLRVVQEFRPQEWDGSIVCYTDSVYVRPQIHKRNHLHDWIALHQRILYGAKHNCTVLRRIGVLLYRENSSNCTRNQGDVF